MIIQKDLTDKNKSIYKCDMCKKQTKLADIYKISKKSINDKGNNKIVNVTD